MPSTRTLRPALLAVMLLAASAAACARGPAGTGAAPVPDAAAIAAREMTADQQVIHALNRLAWGPRPGDVAHVRAMGVDRWIALQLDPARIPDPSGDAAVAPFATQRASIDGLLESHPPAQLLRRADGRDDVPTREDSIRYREAARRAAIVGQELVAARVARAVASERQLQEVMVDFWANHFNVFAGKGPFMRHYLVAYERDVIRPNALGKFRTLLGAVAKSPAMLTYLDNAQSVADSGRPVLSANVRRSAGRDLPRGRARPGMRRLPQDATTPVPITRPRRGVNENYARELLELHTLGVDGGYTQQDVIEVARAFTGWTVVPPRQLAGMDRRRAALARLAEPLGPGSTFLPFAHDAAPKVILGTTLPGGNGVTDGERVLDLVARHPATARFIATKLARRLVSDTPPAALVERAAATFMRTDGDIREVVRTIVQSPEFWSQAAWRAKVKTPFEVVVSTLRATGAAPDPTPRTAGLVARLGQPVYGRQTPDGWPDVGNAWMNTGAILTRINFGMAVAAGRIPGTRRDRWPWPATLDTAARERQVDAVVATLLAGGISPDTRAVLVSGTHPLLARAATDSSARVGVEDDATTAGPPDMMMGPGARAAAMRARRDPLAAGPVTGLAQVVGLALGAPEFQRR